MYLDLIIHPLQAKTFLLRGNLGESLARSFWKRFLHSKNHEVNFSDYL